MTTELVPAYALSPEQSAFVENFIETGSALEAYRRAYEPTADRLPVTIRVRAHQVLRTPSVAAEVSRLRAAARAASSMTVEERIAELEEMLAADSPTELRVFGCRYCATGRYQWKDAAELAQAVMAHLASPSAVPEPEYDGDFGFNPKAPVNLDCDHAKGCNGAGVQVVIHHDQRSWGAGTRNMLRGIKQKDGEVTVETLDKLAIRRLLHELRGDIVRKSDIRTQQIPFVPQRRVYAEDMTAAEAIAAYEALNPPASNAAESTAEPAT